MNLPVFFGLIIIGISLNGCKSGTLVNRISFASVDKAKVLLSQADAFTENWSQFDIDARMQKQNSTREELFEFILEQAREWTLYEKKKVLSVIKDFDMQIQAQGFNLNFPDEIHFVKTTGIEEGGADGYTRANYIVLKDGVLSQSKRTRQHLITHELFHILTRVNPDFKGNMYEIIGFKLMNHINYPEDLKAFRITDPDCPQTDSYIKLKVNSESVECTIILYSSQAYNGGNFFDYLNVGFLRLQGDIDKSHFLEDNKPVIYNLNQVTGFYEQVGRNTQYLIHPEEILAENFAFAILDRGGLPNPEIANMIKIKLKE